MKELSKLKKQIAYSYVPRLINLLIVPVQVALLTKNLTVQEYGVLTLLQSSFMILTFIFSLGLQKFLSIQIPGKKLNLQYAYFKSLLFVELISYIVFSLVLYVFLENILHYLKIEEYKESTQVFLLVYFFSLFYNEMGRFLNYRKKLEIRISLGILEKFIELLMITFIIYNFHKDYILYISEGYLLLYIFMGSIYTKYSINVQLFKKSKLRTVFFKRALMFSLPLLLSDISWRFMQNTDFYILSMYNMKIDLGIYAFVVKLINYIYLAGSPIIWVIYPYIVAAFNEQKYFNKKVSFFIEKQYKYAFLFLTFSMGLMLVNLDFFVILLANKNFLIYKNLYYLYSLYPVFLTIMYIQQQSLLLQGKTYFIGIIYFIALVINILLNYIFIDFLGVYGVVLATLFAIIFIVFMQAKENNKIKILVKNKFLFYPFMILFFLYLLKLSINNIYVSNLLFLIVFIYSALIFRIIDQSSIKIIKKFFNRT